MKGRSLTDLAEDLREARWLVATTTRSMRERYAAVFEAEIGERLARDIRADADRLDRAWSRIDRALTPIAEKQPTAGRAEPV